MRLRDLPPEKRRKIAEALVAIYEREDLSPEQKMQAAWDTVAEEAGDDVAEEVKQKYLRGRHIEGDPSSS